MYGKLKPDEAKKLREERVEESLDIILRRKKPNRVPIYSNEGLWKLADQGIPFSVGLYDLEVLEEAIFKFHEDYGFDVYVDYSMLNKLAFQAAYGKSKFVVSDNPNSIQILDEFPMTEEDYDTFAEKGLTKFFFEDLAPRNHGWTSKEDAIAHLKKATEEWIKWTNHTNRVYDVTCNEYGLPYVCLAAYQMPFEYFVCGLRGIKNTSLDLRRHGEKMLECFETYDPDNWNDFLAYAPTIKRDGTYIFESYTCPMAYTILSPKQFEKFYWPWMKKYFNWVEDNNQTAFVYAEGSIDNKLDFFKEVGEKTFGIFIEQDSVEKLKKELPQWTLIGGYPTTLLGGGSVSECIDEAKRLQEAVNYDGNWIFSFDKVTSYPDDMKRDNLKAVLDYFRNVKL